MINESYKYTSFTNAYHDSQSGSQRGRMAIYYTTNAKQGEFLQTPIVIFFDVTSFDFYVLQDKQSDSIAVSLGFSTDAVSLRTNGSYSSYAVSKSGDAEVVIDLSLDFVYKYVDVHDSDDKV